LLKEGAGLRVRPRSNEKEMMALSLCSEAITLKHWPVILPITAMGQVGRWNPI
jgi:hypothetical protein